MCAVINNYTIYNKDIHQPNCSFHASLINDIINMEAIMKKHNTITKFIFILLTISFLMVFFAYIYELFPMTESLVFIVIMHYILIGIILLKHPFDEVHQVLQNKTISTINEDGSMMQQNFMLHHTQHPLQDILDDKAFNTQKSLYDNLTGLLNQQGLYQTLSKLDVQSAITFAIDLVKFFKINDFYGHESGDNILVDFAENLKKHCEEDVIIARYSSGIFTITYLDFKNTKQTKNAMIKTMKSIVDLPLFHENHEIHLKKRVGYATYPEHANTISETISLAHMAAKSSNYDVDTIKSYQPSMYLNLKFEMALIQKLKTAIDHDLLAIHFQKVIQTSTNKTLYLEALVRWHDEEYGPVSPFVLIEAARKAHLIKTLDQALIKKAFIAYKTLNTNAVLSINLSPESLLDDRTLTFINQMVDTYQLRRNQICIEISEKTFKYQLAQCKLSIENYKEAGYIIAIDDFGSDYASLSILDNIQYDIIKIDGQFTRNINRATNQEIVKMVRNITNATNRLIIVEGVETLDQSEQMNHLNCYLQQGFYFHKPESLTSLAKQ